MQIWKYPLSVIDTQQVRMPKGATLLSAQVQEGQQPMLWALVDEESTEYEDRQIQTFGTGQPIVKAGKYLNTYQLCGLVLHVFDAT
jgi:hypothetical protein